MRAVKTLLKTWPKTLVRISRTRGLDALSYITLSRDAGGQTGEGKMTRRRQVNNLDPVVTSRHQDASTTGMHPSSVVACRRSSRLYMSSPNQGTINRRDTRKNPIPDHIIKAAPALDRQVLP